MIKFWFSQIGKCQYRKKLKDHFKIYYHQNKQSLQLPLKSNSLKYTCWFGKNASLLSSDDKNLYKKIKQNILNNLNQLTPQYCLTISQILNNFQFTGDEQLIVKQIKKYIDENIDKFSEKQYSQLKANFYKMNFQKMELKSIKNALFPSKKQQKKKMKIKQIMQSRSIKTTLNCNISPLGEKIFLHNKNKKLKIVGIQHSIQWIQKSISQINNTEAIILEVQPNYHPIKQISQIELTIQRLVGNYSQVKKSNPYFLKPNQVNQYLSNFQTHSSYVYHKGVIDQLRSILKHLNVSNKQIFLGDVTVEEEILQIISKYNTLQLKQSFSFLRYLFLNQQGRYLQDVSKRGCPNCKGHAQLITPINLADENFYPLRIRQQMIAKNIHLYMKSTQYNSYTCFLGHDHLLNVFEQLCKLYNEEGWEVNKQKSMIFENRGKYNKKLGTQLQIQDELNKLVMLQSLYEKRIVNLPIEFEKERELYQKLYNVYRNLLYPFPIKCPANK